MSRPHQLDANGLRRRVFYPTLPADVQDELLAFLAWHRAIAEDAVSKAAHLAELAQVDAGMAGSADHWAKVVKAIDWLLHRVPMRQRYLEIKLAMEEGRWRPTGSEPVTSSEPVPLAPVSAPGTKAGRKGTAGKRSGGS